MPVAIFIASNAWMQPIIPGTTPKTPPSEQLVTVSGGGGLG